MNNSQQKQEIPTKHDRRNNSIIPTQRDSQPNSFVAVECESYFALVNTI